MKKVALIQFRKRPEMIVAEQKEYRTALGQTAELVAISALDESLSWHSPESILRGFDAVILGGSGEFDLNGGRAENDPGRIEAVILKDRIQSLVEYLLKTDFPTLGVCFGHQLIGDIQGGQVVNDSAQKKIGSHAVSLTTEGQNDRLFGSLHQPFIAQYGHKDSLTNAPAGSTVIATGPACRFSALRYGQNVYTVQFHPELTAADVLWRLENSPGYLPEGVTATSLVNESPEASTIIGKFVAEIVEDRN